MFLSTKSNDQKVVKRKRARRNTSRFSHPFSLSFPLTNLVRKWWASREAAGSTWRMMPRMPMPRPFCHGVTVPLGWAEIGRRWTKPTRCWEARSHETERHGPGGRGSRWCGWKVGDIIRMQGFGGETCVVVFGWLWLEMGWFWWQFFFLQHLFLLLLGGLGVGFHRMCFKFQVGPLVFGQISGGSSNSRVAGRLLPPAAHG